MQPPDPCFDRNTPWYAVAKWWLLAACCLLLVPLAYVAAPVKWCWNRYIARQPHVINSLFANTTTNTLYIAEPVFLQERVASLKPDQCVCNDVGPIKAGAGAFIPLHDLYKLYRFTDSPLTVTITRLYFVRQRNGVMDFFTYDTSDWKHREVSAGNFKCPLPMSTSTLPGIDVLYNPVEQELRVKGCVWGGRRSTWTLAAYDIQVTDWYREPIFE